MSKILITSFLFLFLIGCQSSDQRPSEKADRLAQRANEEIERKNYEEAERLLTECIDIHAASNNSAKLAETYATLSTTQILSGKITPSIESLTALRNLYRYAADRTAELHVMFETAKLQFRIGNADEAVSLMHEAFTNSTLYRLDQLHALAGLEAGKLLVKMERFQEALPYLTASYKYYTTAKELNRIIETNSELISVYTALGQPDAAYALFQRVETLFASNNPNLNRPKFYCQVGRAFSGSGDDAFARSNFLQALNILDQQKASASSEESAEALIGLGELYFKNFSFPEAQQYFVAAYAVAKKRSDEYLQGYLLMRISDCLSKVSIYKNSRDGLIRASQLYEQAQTLFSRIGFGLGEALATHRLGFLKERSGDEISAITFYKRAFERYQDNTMTPVYFMLPAPIEALYSSPAAPATANEWFSDRLIGLLLKFNRFADALAYHETMRSVSMQQQLMHIPFNFRDPEKRSRYAEFADGLDEKFRIQLELFHVGTINKSYAAKLQQQLKYIRSKVEADAVTLIREYPVFSYIGFSQQTLKQSMDTKISAASVVLDYCSVNNEMWVFVIRPNQDVTAQKLSSYGSALEVLMRRFTDGLQGVSVQRVMMEKLSSDLHSFLLKPLNISSNQKIIIVPPVHFPLFPFHALSEGGRPAGTTSTVAYLPHLSMINMNAHFPRFLNSIIAFGFTSDFRWGLEFELRDTRSFFKNTQVFVNQSATQQKLEGALGEVLQLSSQFGRRPNGEYIFQLSDGTSSKTGATADVSTFTSLHPFQIVVLSDVQSTSNTITSLHPLLWLLNGSASVIATHYPLSSSVSKMFSENFYSSLSAEINPSLAYRRSLVQLEKRKEFREGFGGASYFYYGIK